MTIYTGKMAKTEKMAKTANPENQENREQKLPSLRVYLMLLHNKFNLSKIVYIMI